MPKALAPQVGPQDSGTGGGHTWESATHDPKRDHICWVDTLQYVGLWIVRALV